LTVTVYVCCITETGALEIVLELGPVSRKRGLVERLVVWPRVGVDHSIVSLGVVVGRVLDTCGAVCEVVHAIGWVDCPCVVFAGIEVFPVVDSGGVVDSTRACLRTEALVGLLKVLVDVVIHIQNTPIAGFA